MCPLPPHHLRTSTTRPTSSSHLITQPDFSQEYFSGGAQLTLLKVEIVAHPFRFTVTIPQNFARRLDVDMALLVPPAQLRGAVEGVLGHTMRAEAPAATMEQVSDCWGCRVCRRFLDVCHQPVQKCLLFLFTEGEAHLPCNKKTTQVWPDTASIANEAGSEVFKFSPTLEAEFCAKYGVSGLLADDFALTKFRPGANPVATTRVRSRALISVVPDKKADGLSAHVFVVASARLG